MPTSLFRDLQLRPSGNAVYLSKWMVGSLSALVEITSFEQQNLVTVIVGLLFKTENC